MSVESNLCCRRVVCLIKSKMSLYCFVWTLEKSWNWKDQTVPASEATATVLGNSFSTPGDRRFSGISRAMSTDGPRSFLHAGKNKGKEDAKAYSIIGKHRTLSDSTSLRPFIRTVLRAIRTSGHRSRLNYS